MPNKQSPIIILGLMQVIHGFEIMFRTFNPMIYNPFVIKFSNHEVLKYKIVNTKVSIFSFHTLY